MGFDSSVFRQISKGKEKQMYTVIFEIKLPKNVTCVTIEICALVDGEEFVSVRKVNEERKFLIRRSALTEIKDTV
jgi:hypothetical protein